MNYLLGALICLGFLLLPIGTAHAVHKGAGDLTCGGCHTMHNIQGGTQLEGSTGGSSILLRGPVGNRAQIHNLCLQCHGSNGSQNPNGQQPHGQRPPTVFDNTASWTQTDPLGGNSGNTIGAGGNFYPELNTLWDATTTPREGRGHSVGATNVTPPGGDVAISEFSCTNCHDPHGAASDTDPNINRFRNLRKNATGAGNNAGVTFIVTEHTSYVGGLSGGPYPSGYFGGGQTNSAGNVVWPVFRGNLTGTPATDAANSNSYSGGSTGGMSKWCAQCHDDWHESITTTNPAGEDWRRHPVDYNINITHVSGAGVDTIRPDNYDPTKAGQVLPVADGAASNRVFYMDPRPPNGTDRVFCLTCHFAHGGPYYDNLRWDYLATVSAGNQTGNAVPSTRGCQLCHNR